MTDYFLKAQFCLTKNKFDHASYFSVSKAIYGKTSIFNTASCKEAPQTSRQASERQRIHPVTTDGAIYCRE